MSNAEKFEQTFHFKPFKQVPIDPEWWDEEYEPNIEIAHVGYDDEQCGRTK